MSAKETIEVHNVWTLYGMNPDGSEIDRKLAEHSRPQDWGHPRWTYHRFRFEWLTSPDGKHYINHVHCWTDLKRKPNEYVEIFASLIVMILLPGEPEELCGRDFMEEEDFWSKEWGEMPPFYEKDQEDWYESY